MNRQYWKQQPTGAGTAGRLREQLLPIVANVQAGDEEAAITCLLDAFLWCQKEGLPGVPSETRSELHSLLDRTIKALFKHPADSEDAIEALAQSLGLLR